MAFKMPHEFPTASLAAITFPCLHSCCAETDITDINHPVEHGDIYIYI